MNFDYARPGYTVTPNIVQDEITGQETVKVLQADVRSGADKEFINQQNTREQANGENWFYDENGNATYGSEANDTDINNLLSSVGGPESYNQMLLWAQATMSDDDIAEFDAVIEAGDLTDMSSMMGQLQQLYENRTSDVEPYSEVEQFIYDEICTPSVFRDVQQWVDTNLNDEQTDDFHWILNNGNEDYIQRLVGGIISTIETEQGFEYGED
ncbi:MAG: hypothetical protein ACR2M9_03890 [Cyanophyceae cyanobacterium]